MLRLLFPFVKRANDLRLFVMNLLIVQLHQQTLVVAVVVVIKELLKFALLTFCAFVHH